MKILLIEDDGKIADFISKGLKREGFAVDHSQNGEDGLHLAIHYQYQVIVVDIMLPIIDGLELISRLRAVNSKVPVIILSAKDEVGDRVNGLQAGADDYLVKPFAFSELLARVMALIRRSSLEPDPTRFIVDDLELDLKTGKVKRAGQLINLQPGEFTLLVYLMRNKGHIVTKTMIIEQVWNYNFDPTTNVVEVRICRLREKIDKDYDTKLLHTIRGFGYVLEKK